MGLVEVPNSVPLRSIEVKLTQTPNHDASATVGSCSCSCGGVKSLGRPCKHVLAAFRCAEHLSGKWNHKNLHWFHGAYHLSNWEKQYQNLRFPTTAVTFTEADRRQLLPPPMEKKRGRKKAGQKPYARKPDQQRVVYCRACGAEGHMMKTCPEPNAAVIAKSYGGKMLPVTANFAADYDGVNVDGRAEAAPKAAGVAAIVTEEVARQMGANPNQKLRRVTIEFE